MNKIHIASIFTVLAVVFLSISLVSALSSTDAVVVASLSNSTPKAGDSVMITVTFQSNVAQQLQILGIGVHGDWMQDVNQLYGPNFQNQGNIPTVNASGSYAAQFSLPIPSGTSVGPHTLTVTVAGLDANNAYFEANSTQIQIQVLSPSGSTNPTGNTNGGLTDTSGWLPYIVVAAAAVVVVVLVLLVMMRNRKTRKPTAQPASESSTSMPPESKPDQQPDRQDFDI